MAIKGELFSTDMVRAFLENRKSRTSRPIKPQPICYGPNITFQPHNNDFFLSTEKGWLRCRTCGHDPEYSREGTNISHHYMPKYQVGDIMYVRETWCEFPKGKYHFRADYGTNRDTEFYQAVPDVRWRPSIFMPREAARLFFRVTDVKVQKLEDMTEQDAEQDGFIRTEKLCGKYGGLRCDYALERFQEFWKKQYGTESPWMWVYYLEPVTKEEALKEATP